LLHADDPQALPRVVFARGSAFICRMALPVSPTGEYLVPMPTPISYGPVSDDPRLVRPPPWCIGSDFKTVLLGAAACFIGLIVPAGVLLWPRWPRSWKLGLLTLSLLGTLIVWVLLASGPAGFQSNLPALAIGLAVAGPALIPVVLIARAVTRRHWGAVGGLVACTLLAGLILSGVALAIDMRRMEPAEHYSWHGWYLVLVPGASAAGIVLVAGVCVLGLLRRGRSFIGGSVRQPQAG
jgi:hypothetical protein